MRRQFNNLPYLKTFRRDLRNGLTPAEAFLWDRLKRSKLDNRKFRRQHSVAGYILDFYCSEERLAIELDGEVHYNDIAWEYDNERTVFLKHFGIKVIRFENKLVFEETEWVLEVIKSNFGWREAKDNKEATPS